MSKASVSNNVLHVITLENIRFFVSDGPVDKVVLLRPRQNHGNKQKTLERRYKYVFNFRLVSLICIQILFRKMYKKCVMELRKQNCEIRQQIEHTTRDLKN